MRPLEFCETGTAAACGVSGAAMPACESAGSGGGQRGVAGEGGGQRRDEPATNGEGRAAPARERRTRTAAAPPRLGMAPADAGADFEKTSPQANPRGWEKPAGFGCMRV